MTNLQDSNLFPNINLALDPIIKIDYSPSKESNSEDISKKLFAEKKKNRIYYLVDKLKKILEELNQLLGPIKIKTESVKIEPNPDTRKRSYFQVLRPLKTQNDNEDDDHRKNIEEFNVDSFYRKNDKLNSELEDYNNNFDMQKDDNNFFNIYQNIFEHGNEFKENGIY
jgi:hypothetical protein